MSGIELDPASPPSVLYHGSPVLVPVLEPREGFVYAAHDRCVAIPFALVFRADARGRCKWSFNADPTNPRIEVQQGWLDTTGVGYLYHLPVEGFENRRWQWVAREPVRPLRHEVIRSADFVSWIASGETR